MKNTLVKPLLCMVAHFIGRNGSAVALCYHIPMTAQARAVIASATACMVRTSFWALIRYSTAIQETRSCKYSLKSWTYTGNSGSRCHSHSWEDCKRVYVLLVKHIQRKNAPGRMGRRHSDNPGVSLFRAAFVHEHFRCNASIQIWSEHPVCALFFNFVEMNGEVMEGHRYWEDFKAWTLIYRVIDHFHWLSLK